MDTTSFKVNRSLLIICSVFVLIGIRIFHLGIVQRETLLKEAQKPKVRSLVIPAPRGEIFDRFGIPLAINQLSYNATIYYSEISQIPTRKWETDESGKQVPTYPRREYVKKLSLLLEKELGMDASRIEDLIHSKATILPHVPFLIKTNLHEKEYYRIKILERDFTGLHAEIGSKREYPLGKVGCHLIGTIGSINSKEYMSIAEEIRSLQEATTAYETFGSLVEGYCSVDEIYQRLDTLKDKAYTFNDKVGKTGVEQFSEEKLRGSFGLKVLEVDHHGKPFKELPGGKAPKPGEKVVLAISSELQQFAEELLIQNEQFREGRSFGIDPVTKTRKKQKQPWIKGGSIVALDPKTGELIAMASCPRFDPNDFVDPSPNALRWLESKKMIGALWDGRENISRETFNKRKKQIQEEQLPTSWEFFLSQAVPLEGPLKMFFEKIDDIWGFVHIQEDFQDLIYFSKCSDPEFLMETITKKGTPLWDTLRSNEDALQPMRRLDAMLFNISSVQDRLFAIDLSRLCLHSALFSDELLEKVGNMKVSDYRALNQAFCRFADEKKKEAARAFHREAFNNWRVENMHSFLTDLRAIEKKQKTYARPYIDYLDRKEKELFEQFWKEETLAICYEKLIRDRFDDPETTELQKIVSNLPADLGKEFLRTFRFYESLDLPLYFKHPSIKTEKDLASAFYPEGGFGYIRSYAFQAPSPQGSVFKLVSGYTALQQGHTNFTLIDEQATDPNVPPGKNLIVAYNAKRVPYPRLYKGGRLPKTAKRGVGKIDMIGALEHSSNPYFSILAGDYLKDPEDINVAATSFGYANKTGVDLPFEASGNLPSDLKMNRTGLYSYAIGQHTLLCTPLQTAVMLSTLANGGNLLKPKIIQDTNIKTVRETVELPQSIRDPIMRGMDKCTWSDQGCARPGASIYLHQNPSIAQKHETLRHQMIGKTGTAEVLFNPGKYPSSHAQMYKHIWYGSISFDNNSIVSFESPELVVVVFLRFGSGGKEAAPIAGQIIQKWREIKRSHEEELEPDQSN